MWRLAVLALSLSASLTWAQTLGAELLLPSSLGKDAYRPAVAASPSTYLVAWQSGRQRTGSLVGARVSATGELLDATPFLISGAVDDQERVRLAYGGGVFLAVWQDLRNGRDYDVYAARIKEDGTVLDPEGLPLATGARNQCNPVVVFNGSEFVVAFEAHPPGKPYEIQGLRLTPDGTVSAAPSTWVSSGSYFHRLLPTLAAESQGTVLLVWAGQLVYGVGDVGGAVRLQTDGSVTPLPGYKSTPAAPFGDIQVPMSVASNGSDAFIAWRTYIPVGRATGSDQANAVLAQNDALSRSINMAGGYVIDPRVTWLGTTWLSAWSEQKPLRGDDVVRISPFDEVNAAVWSAAGDRVGGILKVAGTFASPARCVDVAVGAGGAAIVYERHPVTAADPIRVGVRLLTAP